MTNPLVFIKTPMLIASRHGNPVNLAAVVHPMIFPVHATKMTATQKRAVVQSFNRLSLVLRPEEAKYSGKNTMVTTSSIRWVNSTVRPPIRGIMMPAENID